MTVNARTPAEQAVHDETERQLAAGGDPFGDDEPIVPETIEASAAKAAAKIKEAEGVADDADDPADEGVIEPKAEETQAEEKPGDEPAAAEPDAEPAPDIDIPAPRFRTPTQEAMNAERARLHDEKKAAFKATMSGEMEPDEYAAIESRVTDALLQIAVQASLAENNAQTTALAVQTATLALMKSAKAAGTIDYVADVPAQKQFDMALNMLLADPDNAGKPYPSLLAQSHEAVMALRGLAKPEVKVDKTPPPRTPPAAPVTLRGLPSASTPNTGGTIVDAMGRLKGQDYQAAFSKLTPAQKAAMVDD